MSERNSLQHWPIFNRTRRRQALMDEMMEVQEVNLLEAVRHNRGISFVKARKNCQNCVVEKDCVAWMATDQVERPDFCPNIDFFESVRR